jgi:hypothetical protein
MKRESLSLQQRRKIDQKLPSEIETELIEFQHFVIGLCQRNKYSSSLISNADETAVFFDMPHSYTINLKGKKQVAVKTTDYEKLCVIVMLCIPTTSNKLPPYAILNRKAGPKENFCNYVRVQAQKNGWMTLKLLEDWLGCAWELQLVV